MNPESLFEYNCAVIAASHQARRLGTLARQSLAWENTVVVSRARSGDLTCMSAGLYLHSPYDPVKEARKLVSSLGSPEGKLFFVFGLAFGYHVQALLESVGESAAFFIFELNVAFFAAALRCVKMDFLQDARVSLFVGNRAFFDFQNAFSFSSSLSEVTRPELFFLETAYRLQKEDYFILLSSVRDFLAYNLQNRFTSFAFEKLWVKNILRNLTAVYKDCDASALFGKFLGKSAVVVSAGPSLRKSLETLKTLAHKFYIFAVDTALIPLLAAGIQPDFIVSVDAQFYNFRDFFVSHLLRKPLPALFYDLAVYPAIPNYMRSLGAQLFYFSALGGTGAVHPLVDFFAGYASVRVSSVSGAMSVSSVAVELARLMGFCAVVLLGQDLQYSGLMTHVVCSPVYNDFAASAGRVRSLETLFYQRVLKTRPRKVSRALTTWNLMRLAEWFRNYMRYYPDFLLPFGDSLLPAAHGDLCEYSKTLPAKSLQNPCFVEPVERDLLADAVGACLSDLYKGLSDFSRALARELESELLQIHRVEAACDKLLSDFPFLSRVFMKDRFWFSRKLQPDLYSQTLYLNTLFYSCMSVLRVLQKLLKD